VSAIVCGGGRLLTVSTIAVALVCLWSYVDAADRLTWWMEALPVLIVYPLVWAVRRRFPLTPLLTLLIALHSVILLVGAHYTYAEVPLFHWIRDAFDLSRNHYDRVGHLAQGFIPAIAIRELLLRTSPLRPGRWLCAFIVFSALGVSASYELLEWLDAVLVGGDADAFLATQGDIWDTQKDMALAGSGAILAQLLLAGFHDHQLAALPKCQAPKY
jgi:putative membrane protein